MSGMLNQFGLVKFLSDTVAASLASMHLSWPAVVSSAERSAAMLACSSSLGLFRGGWFPPAGVGADSRVVSRPPRPPRRAHRRLFS